jgi:hypothetical protein
VSHTTPSSNELNITGSELLRGRKALSHTAYIGRLSTLLVCALAAIYMVNWVVDPLALGSLLGPGVFASDYRFEREVRYNTLSARRPEVVVLGTSETGHGIDPKNPLLGGAEVAYNASLSGGSSSEIARIMEHIAALGSVRRVVIGIDYMMTKRQGGDHFNDAFLVSDGLEGSIKAVKARLSTTMLISSFKQIMEKATNRTSYADESGHLLPARFEAMLAGEGGPYGAVIRDVEATTATLAAPGSNFGGDLNEIIKLACQNHIDLTLFTPPWHMAVLEVVEAMGQWPALETWESRVEQAVRAAPCPVTVWDFTRVNASTTEAIPPPGTMTPMPDYWDMVHFRVGLGNQMLSEMFGPEAQRYATPRPDDNGIETALGERLTSDNLTAFQRQRQAAFADYLAAHPEEFARIRGEVARTVGR